MPYVYQPYPRWKYHSDGRALVVPDQEAEAALGPGWADTPAAFYEPDPALPVPELPPPPKRRRKPRAPKPQE